MRTWEVRRSSGRGFLEDQPIAAYKDLDENALEDLKAHHAVRHVGKLEDFVVLGPILKKSQPSKADFAGLPSCWQGEAIPTGTVYCVILEWTDRQSEAPAIQSLQQIFTTSTDGFVAASQNAFRARDSRAAGSTNLGAQSAPRKRDDFISRASRRV